MHSLNQEKYKKQNRIKTGLLGIILFSFFVLILHSIRPIIKTKDLKGYFIKKEAALFSTQDWFNGVYQKKTEEYLNQEFGFRNLFVRLHNQIRFSWFKKTNAEGIVIGKDNFLYENAYIDSYNGLDFIGEKALTDSVAEIKKLQDTLASLGKHLLVVLAPSKVRIYPEYISELISGDPKRNTNYKFLEPSLKNAGVNYIDFNSVFLHNKPIADHFLYPQLGIHWSRFEALKAYDSIINKLSFISGVSLPKINFKAQDETNELQEPDDDIANAMNLLYYPAHSNMVYPKIVNENQAPAQKNLLTIADSYWWDIFLTFLPKKTFGNNEFWYYNKEAWSNSFFGKKSVDSLDLKRKILQHDFFVIMSTECNYHKLGFGFVPYALSALRKPIKMTTEEKNDYVNYIKENKQWMQQIIKKASENKISIDSMIYMDADWTFQRNGPLRKTVTIKDVKENIYNNPEWLKEITAKAKSRKISVDSMVTLDAKWYMQSVLHLSDSETSEKYKDLSLSQVKQLILNNSQWFEEIKQKAKKRGISVDSMMTLDAIWFKENANQ